MADGALVDIFCSMYSVSCKVLNNLYHYFYQQLLLKLCEDHFAQVNDYIIIKIRDANCINEIH